MTGDGPTRGTFLVGRWWQLGAGVVAMMAIANLQYAWTLFTVPLTRSLHATLSAVQVAFTLFVLAETWLVPFEGYLVDRLGARLIVTVGGVLVGAGWIGSGLAESLPALYAWYAFGGVGAGAVYGACVGTALKWFPDRRGLAAGVTAGAYGFGTALTVLPIQGMIVGRGYQAAFIVWGAVQGVVVLVAAQLMAAPPAGDQPPDGARVDARLRVPQAAVSRTPGEMLRTGRFWLMYLMMALVAFGGLMVTAQLKPLAATYGLDKTAVMLGISALALALMLDRVVNGLTRPFWGWVSDHIGRCNAMGLAFALEALAILALLRLVDRPVWFVLLSGVTFFAWGEIFSLFPATIGDVFGPAYAATNYGLQYTSKGMASIFAGWGAAKVLETTGSWVPVFWIAAACDLAAALLAVFWLKPLLATVSRDAAPRAGEVPTLG